MDFNLSKSFINIYEKDIYQKNWNDLNLQQIAYECSRTGNLKIIQFLIENSAPIADYYYDHITKYAIENQHVHLVKYLFINIKNIDLSSGDYEKFRIACRTGNLELVKFIYKLIDHPDKKNVVVKQIDDFPFRLACMSGNLDLVQQIYRWCDGDINVHIYNAEIFKYVCRKGWISIAKQLYEWDPNVPLYVVESYAFRLACRGGHTDMALQLLEWFPLINIHAINDWAFRDACGHGSLTGIHFLWNLSSGTVNIHAEKEYAFVKACMNGHLAVATTIYYWSLSKGQPIDIHIRKNIAFDLVTENEDYELLGQLCRWAIQQNNQEKLSDLFIKGCYLGTSKLVRTFIESGYKMKSHDYENINQCSENIKKYLLNIIFDTNIKKIEQDKELCIICKWATSDRLTTCGHLFCSECIRKWLDIQQNCPYCRATI